MGIHSSSKRLSINSPVAPADAFPLLVLPHLQKHPQIITISKIRVLTVGTLDHIEGPPGSAHRFRKPLRAAVIDLVFHSLRAVQTIDDLGFKALVIHIAPRLTKTLRIPLKGLKEEVVLMKHITAVKAR